MAKIIKMTPECIDELRKEFEFTLKGLKLSDGRLNYTKSFGNIDRKANVFFTKIAWDKMQALIKEFYKEIAWHGLAYRGEDGSDDYFITDILVYPQEVTASTVTTDQEKYQMWLMQQEDDVFNNIRMQGHSHVNMGVTPSSVDTSLYDRILDQLDDDMFYIFLIYNKKGDKTFKIYDLAKNVMFDTADVTVKVLDDVSDTYHFNIDGITEEESNELSKFLKEYRTAKQMTTFVKEAKEMVKDKVTTYSGYQNGPSYSGGYWEGSSYHYGSRNGCSGSAAPASSAVSGSASASAKDQKTSGKSDDKKCGDIKYLPESSASKKRARRKGKRRAKANVSGIIAPHNSYEDDEWDDEDDLGGLLGDGPYSPFGYSRDGFAQ